MAHPQNHFQIHDRGANSGLPRGAAHAACIKYYNARRNLRVCFMPKGGRARVRGLPRIFEGAPFRNEGSMKFFAGSILAFTAFVCFSADCPGQSASPNPSGDGKVARYANVESLKSLPDWSGIWTYDFGPPPGVTPEQPSLTPAAAAELKTLTDEEAKNEEPPTESANCVPPGMPTIMSQPYDVEFLFTPGRVTIIQEAYMQVRRVFTDGDR